ADRRHQHRQRVRRRGRAVELGAERLEDRVRAEDHRAHRARQGRRGAGADHPDRDLAAGRLHGDAARHLARRGLLDPVPRAGLELEHLGHDGRRHHRRGGAVHGGRRRAVRSPMSPVVTARGLTKRYGAATVVDGIDFDVAKGEIFGLLGPNGAGKTTTILMMLGLTDVSGGEIRVLDHDPVRDPLAVKRRVGYLPDQVGFYDNLTAYDNLSYTASLMGIPARERRPRIMEALDRVRLADVVENKVRTYSRGMR